MGLCRRINLIFVCAMMFGVTCSYAFMRARVMGPATRVRQVTRAFSRERQGLTTKWSASQLRMSADVADTSPFLITTPIYYVNGQPHLGHAYTSVACDIIARFQRCNNREVFFLTGTDEHGQKVEQSAVNSGKTPIQFADEVSGRFKDLVEQLGCAHNDFIRTTEERHKEAVAALWKRLEERGHIYLGAYEGWYSVRDEAFYAESELVDGKAPTGAPVEWVKEESYFFKLSEWTEPLLDFYEKNPDFIGPKGRRNEVISFVSQEGGLRDLSVSRTTFSWGVDVPGSDNHVVYVWLDALTNYITAVGYPDMSDASQYSKYWPAGLHVVGKDILRFHAVFWPAFLMAAGLEPPKRIFAHGWWTKDGEKMSKSLGNVVEPFELIETYGKDYCRYFMASEVPFGNDGDFSHEAFAGRINSDLANDFGNLAQRVLSLIAKNMDCVIPTPGDLTEEDKALLKAGEDGLDQAKAFMSVQNLKAYCETVISLSRMGNKYIDVQAPWALRKTDTDRFNTVMYVLAESLRRTALLLQPLTPTAASKLLTELGVAEDDAHGRSFASIADSIAPGTKIQQPTPLFPKIDPEITAKMNAKKTTAQVTVKIEHNFEGLSLDDLAVKITSVGSTIRELKGQKVEKDRLKPHIDELLALKNRYKEVNGGVAYEAK